MKAILRGIVIVGWIAGAIGGCDDGCHGGGHGPPPDAAIDAAIDAAPDGAIDAPIDAPPDAPPGPAISSLATVGGFTQIHQGSNPLDDQLADRLVITGSLLADATTVMIGPLTGAIASATATELRVDVDVPHGFPPGPLAVTASGPGWTTTSPTPLTVTYFVVAPNAPPGGRGTYQSPVALCDPMLHVAQRRDTLDLLAGTHTCLDAVPFPDLGVEVRGAGVGITIIAAGFFGFQLPTTGSDPTPTRFHDFTALAPAGNLIEQWVGPNQASPLVLERLTVTGGSSGVLAVHDVSGFGWYSQLVHVDALTYSATGTALYLETTFGTIANSSITGCGVGIHHRLGGGELAVTDTSITGCQIGVVAGDILGHSSEPHPMVTAQGSTFHAVEAMRILRGFLSLADCDVQSTGAAGILLWDGTAQLTAGTRVEGAVLGLTTSGQADAHAGVSVDDAELIGGQVGLGFYTSEGASLTLRNALVQGGAIGLEVASHAETISFDLGTPASPGNNQLIGGMFAYRDDSEHFFTPYTAVGTLLNGTSYAGQTLIGPAASAPDYELTHDNAITQF